jgi:AraC-like DNA-binding protein
MVFRRRQGDRKAGRFLLGYFVSYLYLIGISYFFVYGNPAPFIHLLRTGHIASLLMPMLAFFYIRQCLYPRQWKWNDIWHLLPAGFFIVDFAPFFAFPAHVKQNIFHEMDAAEYRIGFSQGWLMPTYGHITLRTAIMLGYWIAQARLLAYARNENYHPLRLQYPFTWRWLHIFLATQAFVFLIPLAGVLLKNSQLETVLYSMAAAGTMAIQCFYLLVHPEILYTQTFEKDEIWKSEYLKRELGSDVVLQAEAQAFADDTTIKPIENTFSDKDVLVMDTSIQMVMNTQRPYVKQRYTLHEFAVDAQIAPHKLSAFINNRYGTNFNDYLNKFRIAMVVEKLQAGENTQKTLEAIAQECGFKSRVTFIRAFKKEYNMTPSDYLKKSKD